MKFAVIGLGRFGASVAETLMSLRHEVLAVDKNEEKVQKYSSICTQAVQADSTNEAALLEIGVHRTDHVIVAIGHDIEASILTTLILKDLGVRPVTVKAINDHHRKVLEKIGADRVIHPEREMGMRIAHHLISENIIDYLELSPEFSMAEIAASKEMDGKTLERLNVRSRYGCNIMAIKKQSGNIVISPKATDVVREGDILIVLGKPSAIQKFGEEA